MRYYSVAEARALDGVRLALTAHFAAPWCEAAKAFFKVRGVAFVPVEQVPFETNDELVAWTGTRNAPVAIYKDETPRTGWLEIALMAERLGSGPSLFPSDARQRALCLGIATEIGSEGGFGWVCRMLSFKHMWGTGPLPAAAPPAASDAARKYGYSPEALAAAPERIREILTMLRDQMRDQEAQGSDWLVGDRMSVADILWAHFLMFLIPPSEEICPMPKYQRRFYEANGAEAGHFVAPILISLRDRVLEQIGVPLEF